MFQNKDDIQCTSYVSTSTTNNTAIVALLIKGGLYGMGR